jgi:hypothetical protein
MLRVMSPMIWSIAVLQMPLPGHVYWLIALTNRPVSGFFLGSEGFDLLATHYDCVVGSACAGIRR